MLRRRFSQSVASVTVVTVLAGCADDTVTDETTTVTRERAPPAEKPRTILLQNGDTTRHSLSLSVTYAGETVHHSTYELAPVETRNDDRIPGTDETAAFVNTTGTYRIDAETESTSEQWEWFVSNKSRKGQLRITGDGDLTFSELPQM
ncbi:hypothetical protein AUR64_13860 [Haloprofundus marisrubri]|uniref:Uncharacterized protein n=1 Tax=Haloprofundus marisrubri TaxID=1514971 RepID=A0A0W1R6N5_9EURY|nr:hypothetical protein [Haloprofundus marisrubri]KTG08892.1 hypothetical protein AUR64_13860 [Haloprofundus marisrubri]